MGIVIVIAFVVLCCLAPIFGTDSRRHSDRGFIWPRSRG